MKKAFPEKDRWIESTWDMLYLVQCGINSIVPDPKRVARMDLEKIYVRSRSQSLEVLTYMALESLMDSNYLIQIPDQNQVLEKWKETEKKAIAKNLMMDIAREQLFAFLEERGIWHIALKGAVLCHMYPKYGMRQMADNDILFDPSFRQEVHDWFVEQGYEVEHFQTSNHDVYLKKPVYNFEMHVSLFQKSDQPQLTQYYLSINDRLVLKTGKSFEYYMTEEDFYLYIVAHEYKHYSGNGIGLRFLLDIYVLQSNRLDWKYLDMELTKMGLKTFEKKMRTLAQKIFDPNGSINSLTKKEKELVRNLVFGETYGTRDNFWYYYIQEAQKAGKKVPTKIKVRYLIHKIFPDKDYMETWCQRHAPYFLRFRCLMPVASIWRIIKISIKKRKQIKKELSNIKKA